MRLLPFILAITLMMYPACALDVDHLLKPLDDLFRKLSDVIYGSDIVREIELFRANYITVGSVYVERTTWDEVSSGNRTELNVIVQFRDLPSREEIYRLASFLGADVYHIDEGINAVVFRLADRPKLLEFIQSNASGFGVVSVYLDFAVSLPDFHVGSSTPIFEVRKTVTKDLVRKAGWNIKLINVDDAWLENVTGKGVVIAIVDTGVDANHTMLKGKIIANVSVVDGEDPHDYHGHGTHVAAIAAGRPVKTSLGGYEVWVSGVAPDAKILNVKVLGKNGGGTMSSVIRGLDYVAQWHDSHPDVPIVVSMSLGTPYGNPSDPVCQKVNWLVREKGIPVIVAAGNEYVVIDSPGLAEEAITVAAVDGDGKVADFSGKGPGTNWKDIKPDIAAPGVAILSARANTNELIEMSGTSMATPHVAGIAALILEERPDLKDKPDEVRKLIEQTATDTVQPEILEGHGIADAYAAIKNLPPKNRFSMFEWFKSLFGGG